MTVYLPIVDLHSKLLLPNKPIVLSPDRQRDREREQAHSTRPKPGRDVFRQREPPIINAYTTSPRQTRIIRTARHNARTGTNANSWLVLIGLFFLFLLPFAMSVSLYVSFCLIKKERRWDSCQTQVTPRTVSWIRIQRITRLFVVSDWSRNSASRSCRRKDQYAARWGFGPEGRGAPTR